MYPLWCVLWYPEMHHEALRGLRRKGQVIAEKLALTNNEHIIKFLLDHQLVIEFLKL